MCARKIYNRTRQYLLEHIDNLQNSNPVFLLAVDFLHVLLHISYTILLKILEAGS